MAAVPPLQPCDGVCVLQCSRCWGCIGHGKQCSASCYFSIWDSALVLRDSTASPKNMQ